MEPTSLTHCESHFVLQQYESCAQTSAAQLSHVVFSFVPAVQMECEQVELVPQLSPQYFGTSPTQMLSHELLQQ